MSVRGFTLVEVMVALAVVAIALPALMMALSQQMDDTAYLRDKTIAQMVAANKLAEMRLVIASTDNLTAGKENGFVTMVDRDWYWWAETKSTPVEKYFRIEIVVASEEDQKDQPLYTLNAFMSSDVQINTGEFLQNATDPTDPNDPNESRNPTDPANPNLIPNPAPGRSPDV